MYFEEPFSALASHPSSSENILRKTSSENTMSLKQGMFVFVNKFLVYCLYQLSNLSSVRIIIKRFGKI